ncbi:hypothetical protein MCUN1_000052 [Malassezia cuniculi]|uniref:Uncharacterized protein n=1 Tax=Malassezia cuniculi TaxID=948313 RepID=A0AAF0J5C6_9BASI|nr:hypothetical protein MCUN1_000052 [Malassezia cuniculi]
MTAEGTSLPPERAEHAERAQRAERTALAERAERSEPQPEDQSDLTRNESNSLRFLQMNTPLSMMFVVAVAAFGVLVTPSMDLVLRRHRTYLTPSPHMLMVYMCILFFFQIGFCVLSIITLNRHTQRVIIKSTGSRLAICNYLLSLWLLMRIFDTPRTHRFAALSLAIIAVLSLSDLIVLGCRYAATITHPFELLFVHVPNKLLALMVLQVLLGQQLLIVMEWKREDLTDNISKGYWPTVALIVVIGIALAVWVNRSCDIVVYFASIYLDCAILGFSRVPIIGPRSRPMSLTLLMVTSMAVRTLALLLPALLGDNCITRRQYEQVPSSEEPQQPQQPQQPQLPQPPQGQQPQLVRPQLPAQPGAAANAHQGPQVRTEQPAVPSGEREPLLSRVDQPYRSNKSSTRDKREYVYGAPSQERVQ